MNFINEIDSLNQLVYETERLLEECEQMLDDTVEKFNAAIDDMKNDGIIPPEYWFGSLVGERLIYLRNAKDALWDIKQAADMGKTAIESERIKKCIDNIMSGIDSIYSLLSIFEKIDADFDYERESKALIRDLSFWISNRWPGGVYTGPLPNYARLYNSIYLCRQAEDAMLTIIQKAEKVNSLLCRKREIIKMPEEFIIGG